MHQKRIILAASFAAIVGLLIPALFGGKQDIWGKFIYDYQGLIVGILAVFAAAITISQSVATDAAQERRHRQQMFLNQRRDLFAIGRLTNDLTSRLNYVANRSAEFELYLRGDAEIRWSREVRTCYLELLRSSSHLLDKLVSIGDYERGLFDAKLDTVFVRYKRQLEELMANFPDRTKDFPEFWPNSDHAPEKFDQHIREMCFGLDFESRALLAEVTRWEAEIREIYQG